MKDIFIENGGEVKIMTIEEFKNILRNGFIGMTVIIYILWICDIISGNYSSSERFGEIFYFIISSVFSIYFIITIDNQVKERNYPHRYFALSLGVFNLLGYVVWIAIRPKKM